MRAFIAVGSVALLIASSGHAMPRSGGAPRIKAPVDRVQSLLRVVEKYARAKTSRATAFDLLRDPRKAFRSRIDLINRAKSSVVGTAYEFDFDRYGAAFFDALTAAARRGVKVVIGLDRTAEFVYRRRAPREQRAVFAGKIRELEKAGGTIAWYGGLGVQLRRPGSGMHFKALVADGVDALMDGRNIGHEYVERWSDFGGRLRGPVVTDIAAEVFRLLGRCKPYRGFHPLSGGSKRAQYSNLLEVLRAEVFSARAPAKRAAVSGGTPFCLVAWHPLGDEGTFWPKSNRITEALTDAVNHARHEVTLSSNYAHPGRKLRRALIAAAQRGVKVRIVTTGEAASEISKLPYVVTSAHYGPLAKAGCEIYETTRMEHGKMYLIDGKLGAFGSYNASKISDGRNAEGLLFTSDRKVLAELRRALEDTITNRSVRYRAPGTEGVQRTWGSLLRQAVQWPLRLATY